MNEATVNVPYSNPIRPTTLFTSSLGIDEMRRLSKSPVAGNRVEHADGSTELGTRDSGLRLRLAY